MKEELFYIHDTTRGLVDGKPVLWKYNDYGYTTNIAEAKIFSKEEAIETIKNTNDLEMLDCRFYKGVKNMKAKLLLTEIKDECEEHPCEPITKVFDWEDLVEIDTGEILKVKRLSLYEHILIIDDKKYRIAHMFSSENL